MHRLLWIPFVAALAAPTSAAQSRDNGIYVDNPKIYDNAALQLMLSAAQKKLAGLSGFDQSSLTGALGKTQGATLDQTQTSGQINTAAKTAATGQSSSALPTVNLPSSFSPSAADILNEQTQLNAQLTSLQLLLQGALSDTFAEGTHEGKPHVTVGFPITIKVPPGFQYRQAVAEVVVSVCPPPGIYATSVTNSALGQLPSLVNLIPQEKTYNVASIVNKQTSIGAGAIAGLVNFGGSFLRGRQTYYLVKDQDTLAFQVALQPVACGTGQSTKTGTLDTYTFSYSSQEQNALSFAWQFRPVLGQPVVRDGLRQTFAQIALPPMLNNLGCTRVYIQTRWRHYDPKTGRAGKIIPGTETDPLPGQISPYTFAPQPIGVATEDNGDGTLTVIVNGTFRPGTQIRTGSQIVDSVQTDTSIRFTAKTADLATTGAHLVDDAGEESPVEPSTGGVSVSGCSAVRPIPATTKKAKKPERKAGKDKAADRAIAGPPDPPQATAPVAAPAPTPAPAPTAPDVPAPTLNALTDTTSILTITLAPDDEPQFGEIPVLVIGTQVFGTRNNPFLELTGNQVRLVVTNDLLRANRTAKWALLFRPGGTLPGSNLPRPSGPGHPTEIRLPELATPAIALVGSGLPNPNPAGTGTVTRYAISGHHIESLTISSLPASDVLDFSPGESLRTFALLDSVASKLNFIVVRNGSSGPGILVSLPTAPPAPPKTSIDPPTGPIAATATKTSLTGTGMSQITAAYYFGTKSVPLAFTASSDKALTLNFVTTSGAALSPALAAPGVTVVFEYTDKSRVPYFIPVSSK